MKLARTGALLFLLLGILSPAVAQDLSQIEAVWQQTLDALSRDNKQKAKDLFADFNQEVRTYVRANSRTWQIEYLVGTLNCQFPDTRANGAKLLMDVLQNERGLNNAGEQELKRQVAACTAPGPPTIPIRDTYPDLPRDIADASAHFQSPGVHGDMKGGYDVKVDNEFAFAVSAIPASELIKRRVPLSEPQKALDLALARLPAGATGGLVQEFAVTTVSSNQSRAIGIGKCLQAYTPLLKKEFQIEPSAYMVTIYTADYARQVYEYASRIHGLQLPQGVVAYSVPEDMSLAGVGDPDACGTMAHELVHLLIKSRLQMSPAWLEEGLASQVAVATPESDRFKFSWSWRDDTLRQNFGLRPSVAELLEAPWTTFNAVDHFDMRRAAAVQAMAAVFMRYLDSKGVLSEVYFAVRDRHSSPDLWHYKSYREIVEQKLGKNVDQIDADFVEWFQKQESPHPESNRTSEASRGSTAPRVPCDVPNISPQQQSPNCEPQIMNQRAPDPPVEPH